MVSTRLSRPSLLLAAYWFQGGRHPIHPAAVFCGELACSARARTLRCARALGRSPPPLLTLLSRSWLWTYTPSSRLRNRWHGGDDRRLGPLPGRRAFEKVHVERRAVGFVALPAEHAAAAPAARLRARCLHLAFALSLYFRRCDEQLRVGRQTEVEAPKAKAKAKAKA